MDTMQRERTVQLVDPRTAYPKAQGGQPAAGTGREGAMEPRPNHGEDSYVGAGRLANLVSVVTGADSGIGKAVALAYAREGADVVVAYLEEGEEAADTTRLVEAEGRRSISIPGDLSKEEDCRTLIERTVAELGRIDILVNNHAYQKNFQSFDEITAEEFEHTLRVNLISMFNLCKAAVPHMQPGASIINVASVQAYNPSPSLLPYATTKGGIVTFTKALAGMLAEQGIRANVVAPGPVWTPLITQTMPPEKVESFGQDTPLGRPAMPAELAPVFVLLASPEASYITGTVYVVAGGTPLP
jgi:hypothetical protein